MPTPTYDLIASNVLSSSASSVTFSSIPATYRDLVLVAEFGNTSTGRLRIQFNSDTGTNYAVVAMAGDGSSALSSSYGTGVLGFLSSSYTEANNSISAKIASITAIMDYSATDKHKTVLSRVNQPTSGGGGNSTAAEAFAGRWANTAAINTVTVSTANNFNSGSSFYLYGIAS